MFSDPAGYDTLILGGGTAGCALAARLSEDPDRSVCLVEAGPDYGPHGSGDWPQDLVDAREGPSSHDWSDEERSLMVARVIGGCSAHNLCFWVRPAPEDWDEWAAATGDPGWSAAGIAATAKQVERMMPLRLASGDEINPWLRAVMDAGAEIGLGRGDDINGLDQGVAPMPLNARGCDRWNAAFAYLDEARERPNLTIHARALVERVELRGDRAVGAVVHRPDGETRVRAEQTIVSAGTYGSPAILLRSGIGPATELSRHRIRQRAELPVGSWLQDHLAVRFRLAPSEEMQRLIDEHAATHPQFVCQGLFKARSSRCAGGRWDLHGVVVAIPAADAGFANRGGHVLGLSASLLKPAWTGSVRLRSADPGVLPEVSPQDLSDDGDMQIALEGLALCRRLVEAPAARRAWSEQLAPAPALDQAALQLHCAGNVAPYFHPVGTCAMGREGDGRSVVDSSGMVHGVRSLRVADASIIPSIPRANTNMPTLVVAEKIAQRVRSDRVAG